MRPKSDSTKLRSEWHNPTAFTAIRTSCGPGSSNSTSRSSNFGGDANVGTESGLVINGEVIADAELYDAAEGQTLMLYTSYQESSEAEFLKAFTHDTGINVDMVRLVPAQLAERALAEAGAGKLPADVIRISDFKLVQQMQNAGVWQDYVPPYNRGA
jgi:iron(III) transport system substrate-binding protein